MRRFSHTHRNTIAVGVTNRRMIIVISMKMIMRTARIIIAVTRTIIRIVIIRTYTRIVVITRCCPVMTVGTLDITPVIPIRKRVNVHVIISIKIDVRHIITRITHKYISTIIDNIKIIRIRRIGMCMCAIDITPVRISINIINRMLSVVGNACNRCGR